MKKQILSYVASRLLEEISSLSQEYDKNFNRLF